MLLSRNLYRNCSGTRKLPFIRTTSTCIQKNSYGRLYSTEEEWSETPGVKMHSPERVYKSYAFRGEIPYLIDCRPEDVHTIERVIGTYNFPISVLEGNPKSLFVEYEMESNDPLYCLCDDEDSRTSHKAAALLKEHGFTDVRVVNGTIAEMYEVGFQVETGPKRLEFGGIDPSDVGP